MDLISILLLTGGIIMMVVVPGFCINLAVFPRERNAVTIACMSMFLGMVPYFLIYALDKNFGVPIELGTTLGVVIITCIVGLFVWSKRR